jgi:hypothetical protein
MRAVLGLAREVEVPAEPCLLLWVHRHARLGRSLALPESEDTALSTTPKPWHPKSHDSRGQNHPR